MEFRKCFNTYKMKETDHNYDSTRIKYIYIYIYTQYVTIN